MKVEEIEVGATYKIGGQTRLAKRVISYDPHGSLHGGNVRTSNVKPDGSLNPYYETFSGSYFVENVVKKLEP